MAETRTLRKHRQFDAARFENTKTRAQALSGRVQSARGDLLQLQEKHRLRKNHAELRQAEFERDFPQIQHEYERMLQQQQDDELNRQNGAGPGPGVC